MADRRTTFIQTYMPYAQEASAMTGIDPSVILAQAAHETGWGRKAPGNNFFGIKGGGQTFATHEYVNGKRVNVRAGFRRYDDPRGSFLDWAKLMHKPPYAGVLAAETPEEQIRALKAAGYATDPAYVSKLNSVRNQVTRISGDIPAATPDVSAIMDVASLNTAPASIPDQPTAATGFAPVLGGIGAAPAQAAISDLVGQPAPDLTPEQIDILTMTDAGGNYLNQPQDPQAPPSLPPEWASATGFPLAPIDEALTGRSGQDVLDGGPRMDPRRAGPATGPIPADMGAMLSSADVLNAGPQLNPRNAIGSAPVGPTTDQGVLAMGPNMRPEGRWMAGAGGAPDAPPMPSWNPRRDPFGFPIDVNRPRINNGDGTFSTEETTTFDASEVGMPSEIVTIPTIVNGRRVSEDEAKAAFASGFNPAVQRGFNSYEEANAAARARTDSIRAARATNGDRDFPSLFGEQPDPLMGGMSAAMGGPPSLMGGMSAAMGNARPPNMTPASQPISIDPAFGVGYRVQRDADRMATEQDARMAEFAGGMESDRIAAELGMRRREMEPFTPAYRAPETATMGDRFTAASPFPNAEQMFGLPAMNAPASFPGPDPRIGTAEAGSTTGEFFTPAPPMPQPLPDPMAGRFNDAFSPAGPGMIADLQGAFNRQQAPSPPSMTAQDGINSVFGAPPAAATPPNLAIPFAEVPGFGAPPAAASTVPTPPMGLGTFNDRFSPPMPSMAPQPISMGDFNDRFAGGSVVNAPQPGQPGVVQGTMPSPAGAMDIRPPAQGGPPLPPQATPQAAPASPPRQTNPATERQRSGIVGRVLGGLLGGPIGALGGGLLGGGGGGGFGFGTASFNPMGNSFSAPYMQSNGQMGSTKVQPVQSGNMQGTMWNRSNGQGSVGYVTDPFTGSMIYSGSGTTF